MISCPAYGLCLFLLSVCSIRNTILNSMGTSILVSFGYIIGALSYVTSCVIKCFNCQVLGKKLIGVFLKLCYSYYHGFTPKNDSHFISPAVSDDMMCLRTYMVAVTTTPPSHSYRQGNRLDPATAFHHPTLPPPLRPARSS